MKVKYKGEHEITVYHGDLFWVFKKDDILEVLDEVAQVLQTLPEFEIVSEPKIKNSKINLEEGGR